MSRTRKNTVGVQARPGNSFTPVTTPSSTVSARFDWSSYEDAGLNYGVGAGKRPKRGTKLTEYQIAYILQGAGEGVPLDELCRKIGMTDASYLAWRRKYGGLLQSEYDRLTRLEQEVARLEQENERLKKMLDNRLSPAKRP